MDKDYGGVVCSVKYPLIYNQLNELLIVNFRNIPSRHKDIFDEDLLNCCVNQHYIPFRYVKFIIFNIENINFSPLFEIINRFSLQIVFDFFDL